MFHGKYHTKSSISHDYISCSLISYQVRNVLWMNTVRVFKLCVGVHLTLNNPTAFYEPMNHYQNANGISRYYFSISVEFKHPASLLQSLTKVKGKIKCFFETKTTFMLLIVTSSDIFFLMFVGFLSRHFCKLIDYTTMYVHLWSACLIVRLRVTPLVLN